MVDEALADRKLEPPHLETFEALAAIEPVALRIWRVGKTTGVEQQLLDSNRIFAVAAELGNDVGRTLLDVELAVANQDPHRRRYNRLGAAEDAVERPVGRRRVGSALHGTAEGLHRANLAVARDRYLARRQQPFGDLPLGAFEKLFDLGGIETDLARMFGELMRLRHL